MSKYISLIFSNRDYLVKHRRKLSVEKFEVEFLGVLNESGNVLSESGSVFGESGNVLSERCNVLSDSGNVLSEW